jgi:hypothetical protein
MFFKTWSSLKDVKALTENEDEAIENPMLTQLVSQFTPEKRKFVNFLHHCRQTSNLKLAYLERSLRGIQKTLHQMFFGPSNSPKQESSQSSDFLICLIESLWNESESTLATLYFHDFHAEGDDQLSFEIIDQLDDKIQIE